MIHLSRYRVQQLMCETVHSHIYRGLARADNRAVAIKVARETGDEIHAAAQNELEILQKLDGLVTVRAVELDYVEDHPALVMELYPGNGINEWLAGKPAGLEPLRVAIGIAGALAGVHGRGVIHRDLKPSNILVNPETLEVCLADFGVAASFDGAMSLHAAALIGSLAYLSPEQTGRMNRRVDTRSDLYSLGVTFYEMVTGVLPFELTSPLELVHAHFALTPRPASEVNPAVPQVVSELIAKLLAKGPDDRYQSAEGVEADLREVAAQLAAGEPLGGFALGVRDRARTFLLPAKLYGRGAELALLDRCLTLAQDEVQLAAFLEAMRTRYPQHYALVATLAYTGLRFCHASALRWEDWDELTGVLRVVRKHFRGAIGPVSRKKQAPKEYPVEPELAEILRAHRMRLPKTHANGLAERWMFPSTEGTLRTPNSLDRAWAKCLKHAKITKRFTVHGLRYTFTDLVRRANVDAVVPPGTDRPCDGGDAAALLDRRPG